MQEKQINEKESLELISRMIRNTQNHLEENEGIPLLVWGYTTVAITIAVWSAIHFTHQDYWHFLWFAIPILGFILTKIFNKQQPSQVKTYIDTTIGYVWIVLGIACVAFGAIAFFARINILSIVLMLIGSGCTITGLIIKYLPVTIGGIIAMILSAVLLLLQQTLDTYMLIFALAFIAMCIIPGHCLNRKARKSVQLKEKCHV